MTISTESGDWALYATYYFRPDGTVARRNETLNTFYGNVTRTRITFFDCSGKVLKTNVEFRDLESSKQIAAPPTHFISEEPPKFLSTSQLPFAH